MSGSGSGSGVGASSSGVVEEHAATSALWDRVTRAVEKTNAALDDASKAVAAEGTEAPATSGRGGTAGFGRSTPASSSSFASASASASVSGTTRKRVTQRAPRYAFARPATNSPTSPRVSPSYADIPPPSQTRWLALNTRRLA